MTKVLQFTSLFFLMLIAIPGFLFAQSEKQLIYTLLDGEILMYGENCFSLNNEKADIFFITRLNGKFFTNENGFHI